MQISTKKLELLMATRGFSIAELANQSGINAQSLSIIRKRQTCRIGTVGKICAALGCTAAEIVPDEPKEETA